MSSSAKLAFVDHLSKTHPQGWCLVSRVEMTSSIGPQTTSRIVSRFEITDDPDDPWLPLLRRQQLARLENHDASRFLLDQTIHLGVDDTPANVQPTQLRFFVWDQQANRSRELPLNDFQAFPGSALRVADYLLPFPEIATWSLPDPGTRPRSTDAPDRPCTVIAITIPPPPAGASYLERWLWPDVRSVTLWTDASDGRLLLVETALSDDRFRTLRVHAWVSLAGATVASDFTVTDVAGSWSRLAALSGSLKGYGPDYFTRLRLEAESF